MRQIKKGESANATGDVNFAASCMAVGIPLDAEQPVMAIKSDNGRDYGRFFLGGWSLDGKLTLTKVQNGWSHPKFAVQDPLLNGLCYVMEFLKLKPSGVRSSVDWFDWAAEHLRDQGCKESWMWPRKLEEVDEFVQANQETRAGYVFAFIINRDLCLHLARRAGESPSLLINKGNNCTLIDENTPKWRRDQFFQTIG